MIEAKKSKYQKEEKHSLFGNQGEDIGDSGEAVNFVKVGSDCQNNPEDRDENSEVDEDNIRLEHAIRQ